MNQQKPIHLAVGLVGHRRTYPILWSTSKPIVAIFSDEK